MYNESSTGPVTELPGIDAASVSDSDCVTEIADVDSIAKETRT